MNKEMSNGIIDTRAGPMKKETGDTEQLGQPHSHHPLLQIVQLL